MAFDRGWDVWKGWFPLGTIAVVAACLAWLLVLAAREPNGSAIGPLGRSRWAHLMFGYWLTC